MTVGEKIRIRREELNMSQDELAKRVGYKSRSSIQKIEKSRDLPIGKVRQVAAILDINPSYLLGWTEDQNMPAYLHSEMPIWEEVLSQNTFNDPGPDIIETPDKIKMRKMYEAYSKLDPQIQKIVDGILGLEGE